MKSLPQQGLPPQRVDLQSLRYTELLAAAPLFQKRALVHAQESTGTELVRTIIHGQTETINTAQPGDMIVTNPGGERFVMPRPIFDHRYRATQEPEVYAAVGQVRAIPNPTGQPVVVATVWGEQFGDADCYLAVTIDPSNPNLIGSDRYIIEGQIFRQLYDQLD